MMELPTILGCNRVQLDEKLLGIFPQTFKMNLYIGTNLGS